MVYVKKKGGDRFRRGKESVYECKLCNWDNHINLFPKLITANIADYDLALAA